MTRPDDLHDAAAALAFLFHMQPSEIGALDLDEFERWCASAAQYAKVPRGFI